ncbi:MAG TPA: response regulator [Chthoniobacterales bacterium]
MNHTSMPTVAPRSVLVVDDEPELAAYLMHALQEHGWRVSTALDGFEALDHLRQNGGTDLLVLDLGLPRMSGFELARKIKEQYPDTRILVSTGYSVRLEPERMRDLNICAILSKPFTLNTLIEAAERVAKGQQRI